MDQVEEAPTVARNAPVRPRLGAEDLVADGHALPHQESDRLERIVVAFDPGQAADTDDAQLRRIRSQAGAEEVGVDAGADHVGLGLVEPVTGCFPPDRVRDAMYGRRLREHERVALGAAPVPDVGKDVDARPTATRDDGAVELVEEREVAKRSSLPLELDDVRIGQHERQGGAQQSWLPDRPHDPKHPARAPCGQPNAVDEDPERRDGARLPRMAEAEQGHPGERPFRSAARHLGRNRHP